MRLTKCPECYNRASITNCNYNDEKQYKKQYLECGNCGHRYTNFVFERDRAKELLNYEKAYWKMKELLESYF